MANQTIIFDLGKVICPFDVLIPCGKLSELCGISPQQIKELIFFGEPESSFETGQIGEEQFTRDINKLLNLTLTVDELRAIWSDMFELDRSMVSLVEEVRSDNQVMLLSNTSPWHFDWVEYHYAIRRHFDHCILSYEVGYMKPHEEIYKAALAKAENPNTTVFIDDLIVNVKAAQECGITSIQFHSETQLREELLDLGIL